MNSFAKLAAAAVAIAGIAVLGAVLARPPGGSGGPGVATPSPSPSLSPGLSPRLIVPSPPPLTGTFTSAIHGISLSYPAGWVESPASEAWTVGSVDFGSPAADHIYDPTLQDHLFLGLASRPLDGQPGPEWAADAAAMLVEDCGDVTEPTSVDGADALRCGDNIVAAWSGDRGYLIVLYRSTDEWWLDDSYNLAWFETLLATVQLRPEDAVESVGASPGAS
jgi:hypothetical protein